jgi:hypothetical protein
MSFKPTVAQLCTTADMTVGRMTQDFIANRIGVPVDEFKAWRLSMMTAVRADEPLPPPLPQRPERRADRVGNRAGPPAKGSVSGCPDGHEATGWIGSPSSKNGINRGPLFMQRS